MLDDVSFDQVPVLKLFILYIHFLSALLDLLSFLLLFFMLNLAGRYAEFVLLCQDMKKVAFL